MLSLNLTQPPCLDRPTEGSSSDLVPVQAQHEKTDSIHLGPFGVLGYYIKARHPSWRDHIEMDRKRTPSEYDEHDLTKQQDM